MTTPTRTLTLQPRIVLGIGNRVKSNIHFTTEDNVIYTVEGCIVKHDYVGKQQQIQPLVCSSIPLIMTVNTKRTLLAIVEKDEVTKRFVTNVYETSSLKRIHTLDMPPEVCNAEPNSIDFINDSSGIMVLCRSPDLHVTAYYFDKKATVIHQRICRLAVDHNARDYFIACNIRDSLLFTIGGHFGCRVYAKKKLKFEQIDAVELTGRVVTALAWITADVLAVGTAQNELIFIESGNIKSVFYADDCETIDLDVEGDSLAAHAAKKLSVHCFTFFSSGLCFALHNTLYIYDKNKTSLVFNKRMSYSIVSDLHDTPSCDIVDISVNIDGNTAIARARHNQIYVVALDGLPSDGIEIQPLGEKLHTFDVLDMAVCSWRTTIMTGGKDQTVRMWNYANGALELMQKFHTDFQSLDLHPSGIFAAIGFADQLRLMAVMLGELKIIRTFNYSECNRLRFSHYGHLLACACESLINVISMFTFEVVRVLMGHNGQILDLLWTDDDRVLVSCDDSGAIYRWELATGNRINDNVNKDHEYVALVYDGPAAYVLSKNGLLQQMLDGKVIDAVELDGRSALTAMCGMNSVGVLVIADSGGRMYQMGLPIAESKQSPYLAQRWFRSKITKIIITNDGQCLIAASTDGTLLISDIISNRIPKASAILESSDHVVVSRGDLLQTNAKIFELEKILSDQLNESNQMNAQAGAFHSEHLKEVHTQYCDALDKLKQLNMDMEVKHMNEMEQFRYTMEDLKQTHANQLQELEDTLTMDISKEYARGQEIRGEMETMRIAYEERLSHAVNHLQAMIQALEVDFKRQLEERQRLLRDVMVELDDKNTQFTAYCASSSDDHNRRMCNVKTEYEQNIKELSVALTDARLRVVVLEKRVADVSSNCDEIEKDKMLIRQAWCNAQHRLKELMHDAEELRSEIRDRDTVIHDRETRVKFYDNRNQELEKYKSLLTYKIDELNRAVEPRNQEIGEKTAQIGHLKEEIENLFKHEIKTELKLNACNDRWRSTKVELDCERERRRGLDVLLNQIYHDIYRISRHAMTDSKELRRHVVDFYHKYASSLDVESVLQTDADVQQEFMRHRRFLEKQLKIKSRPSTISNK